MPAYNKRLVSHNKTPLLLLPFYYLNEYPSDSFYRSLPLAAESFRKRCCTMAYHAGGCAHTTKIIRSFFYAV
jgi:hypothetical protein